ncbi:MAG TPA: hypothetical protein VH234_02135 [Candidatus Saccharimonadales bacterium]|nr:hypothetical protein [Candidatus Saccharimonadales bacterium]
MVKANLWGGLASALGKAVFFVSLGLFLWGFGETIWSYYNFFKHVPAPYPSVADIGFAPSIFFWILGTFFLSAATGARLALRRSLRAKVFVVAAPLILLVPSYYVQVHLARGGVLIPPGETLLKTILDIAYPIGDFLALIFATLVYALSRRYFGGLYRAAILLLLTGLAIMYCADSIFSYTTTKNTYYNADWGDLLLTVGLYVITLGILAFATKPFVDQQSAAQASGEA